MSRVAGEIFVKRDGSDETSSRADDSDDFLALVERRIRDWIANEWEERQRIAYEAGANGWCAEVTSVHMRSVILTVETLAPRLNGMSEPTLRRRFQQCGATESPGEMIHRLRMEHAAKLLRDGRFTIAAVADMSGFDDKRHFAARFRKHFGITPRDYRQR